MKSEPIIAWQEREEIRRNDRSRRKKEIFSTRMAELSSRNAKMESALYEIHAISKMTTFVEALDNENKKKKKKGCTIS